MTSTQVKVTWKRAGNEPKSKRFIGMKRARRWLTILGPEPWLAHGQRPDDLNCCSGRECGCGGITVREHWESGREGLPPIEWIKIEKRTLTYGEWNTDSETRVTAPDVAQAYINTHPEKYPFEGVRAN